VPIAVLTSGGDAPGMNAAIAGVSGALGADALAVTGGFAGLQAGRLEPLGARRAHRHRTEAGTWLGSSRHPRLDVAACVRALAGADGLVVIGGHGSREGARALAAAGVPVAFVPATIDNDVEGTDTTIGFDSAVAYALGVIGQLRTTGRSLPGRIFVVETLGGPTEHLAVAVARGAAIEHVLVPGAELRVDGLAERAEAGDAIVVMSEGAGDAVSVAAEITARTGVRARYTILGHAQRAAPPSLDDVALGVAAGRAAAAALTDGRGGFVTLPDVRLAAL
jgi:6-phosphofructokinase 1